MWDCGSDQRGLGKAPVKQGLALFSLLHPENPDIASDISALQKYIFNNDKQEALVFNLLVLLYQSVVMVFFAEALVSCWYYFETL